MSGTAKPQFPIAISMSAPFVDVRTGTLTEYGMRVMQALINRTGGTAGPTAPPTIAGQA